MREYKKHRQFIHDISNQLAVSDGALKRARKLQTKEQTSEILSEIDKNFILSEDYIKNCINKLKEYRIYIHSLENNKPD
mgnify:CR=1 FL=1